MVEDLGQRKLPLLINASLLLLLIHKSITISNLPQLYFFFLGGAISTIIALVAIYLQTKISLHMIGITSLTSFIFGMSIHTQTNLTYTFAFFVVVIGWVASSRLVLKAHTIKELSLGFITGLLPQLFLWRFWL
jgi:membrane-associated phospholipid phosphatase